MHTHQAPSSGLPGRHHGVLLLIVVFCLCSARSHAEPQAGPLVPSSGGLIDLAHYRSPELASIGSTESFSPRLAELWLAGLARAEVNERLLAAEALAAAAVRGMVCPAEAVAKLGELVEADPSPVVRAAAAEALDAIDIPAAAASLIAVLGSRDAAIVIPADRTLARWAQAGALPSWRERVRDASVSDQLRTSAIAGLAALEDQSSVTALRAIVNGPRHSVQLRVAAATAAGQISDQGLTSDAFALMQSGQPVDLLLAARLLSGHTEEQAAALAEQLAVRGDAVVSAEALTILLAIDPVRVLQLESRVKTDARPNTRLALVKAHATGHSDQAIEALRVGLDDLSLKVRTFCRDALVRIGQDADRRESVGRAAIVALNQSPSWRGAEQAALVIGLIDYEPAADALLAAMTHARPEVRLAVAEALRRIEVEATLPAILKHAEQLTSRWQAEASKEVMDYTTFAGIGRELTQLFQAIGAMRYQPADGLLQRFIPKSQFFDGETRGAAIYALGMIHEGQNPSGLSGRLAGRVRDITGMEPEQEVVRRFSVITIARIGDKRQVALLTKFSEDESASEVGAACRWALEQLTGEAPPAPEPKDYPARGWYLEPLE